MQKTLTMSTKERDRLKIIQRIDTGPLIYTEAAELMNISERHLYRILDRYRTDGDAGLIHKLRGQTSNRGFAPEIRNRIIDLYREKYSDYGPTYFSEMVYADLDIHLNDETIRKWLLREGLWKRTRKGRKHRKKRPRHAAIGALIQLDGSHHKWFEDRAPECCLIVFIDDASGQVFLRFVPSENAHDLLVALRLYIEHYGIPGAIYIDRGSVFHGRDNQMTDFTRALTELNIKPIFARSPQAKGRVERSNRTHQDRLIKALRRENISSIEEANQYLETVYIEEHNKRFAHCEDLSDVHRSPEGINLDNIICFEITRCVYNDYTIRLNSLPIQLLPSEAPLPPPRTYVTVRRWLDGSMHIFWKENELTFIVLDKEPKPKQRTSRPPAQNHPWRTKLVGRGRTYTNNKHYVSV
jgi:transposase